jgi:hypothetical protein
MSPLRQVDFCQADAHVSVNAQDVTVVVAAAATTVALVYSL